MIQQGKNTPSLARQCELLGISRSTRYYQAKPSRASVLELMRLIDEQYLKTPFYGSRSMMDHLRRLGHDIGRDKVRSLMRRMGLEAVYPRPRTSKPQPGHKIYPYLLRGLKINRPNQVWATDITYVPMARGFMYLVTIMDWYSRKVLAWRVSNSLEADFCLEALKEALNRHGTPEIFNTDQGSQFTSLEFTGVLKDAGVSISMDGRGRFQDNILVERQWWTVKYQYLYLHTFDGGADLRKGLKAWFDFYNSERPHQAHGGRMPDQVYGELPRIIEAA
ncbi:MAG: hypothetical protein A2527_02055 [Candidatus Lambdaproteobacteria bacterium RIFOXYD2_FULL_50_16]|uniref:Integrase catalytic domain-containing protein n=1 Tax=Candidatus Lambdaproteobacteria bacterium RIFOXYD2_FULL_50_16 TaxID=1817772 RepID=A0A1F6GE35_9PROT|nr:MAG: hypothetical protein A2527_02055 [Candidatus Lambdaproteobacteria bacterium RIFOXYD2_FULL_50_16]